MAVSKGKEKKRRRKQKVKEISTGQRFILSNHGHRASKSEKDKSKLLITKTVLEGSLSGPKGGAKKLKDQKKTNEGFSSGSGSLP